MMRRRELFDGVECLFADAEEEDLDDDSLKKI